jgi:hypothetical protein
MEAAKLLAAVIEKELNSVTLTALQQEELPVAKPEALEITA